MVFRNSIHLGALLLGINSTRQICSYSTLSYVVLLLMREKFSCLYVYHTILTVQLPYIRIKLIWQYKQYLFTLLYYHILRIYSIILMHIILFLCIFFLIMHSSSGLKKSTRLTFMYLLLCQQIFISKFCCYVNNFL